MAVEILEGLEKNSYCMYLYGSNGGIGQDGGCDSPFFGRWSNNVRFIDW